MHQYKSINKDKYFSEFVCKITVIIIFAEQFKGNEREI
jgi:hypothetical protein